MNTPANNDPMIGIGGAPTRSSTLPTDAKERKNFPLATGCLDYFPDALIAVANLSKKGNDQHNPGQPLHWARNKSGDEADTALRHFTQRGTFDTDGVRHTVKWVWRSLAFLQKELEAAKQTGSIVCEGAQQESALDKAVREIQAEKEKQKAIDTAILAQRDARNWRPMQPGEIIEKGDQYKGNGHGYVDFDASVGCVFDPMKRHSWIEGARTTRPIPERQGHVCGLPDNYNPC